LLASITFKSHATAAFVECVNARRPYHIHNAACVEAGHRANAQIKGCSTIGSNKALA
jgi:hypothetical protein